MKTHRKHLTAAALTAFALCVAPLALTAQEKEKPADNRADKSYSSTASTATTPTASADTTAATSVHNAFTITPPSTGGATVRAAAKDVDKQSAKKLAGNHVRGSDGKDLGKINDFLVDSHSGEVAFAIVSSGGLIGAGDKLRLVPFTALTPAAKGDEFSLKVEKAAWDQIPTVKEAEFKSGQFTMTAAARNQQASLFNGGTAAVGAPAAVAADTSASLVRASDIAGRSLHSGGQAIGNIENVIIDRDTCTATALLDPKKGFANSSQKFLVPFAQLQIAGAKHDPITTSLTRAEFDNVTVSSANTPPAVSATNTTAATTSSTDKTATSATTPAATSDTTTASISTTPSATQTPGAVAATTELNRDLTASTSTTTQPADTVRADASTEPAKTTSSSKDNVATTDSSATKSTSVSADINAEKKSDATQSSSTVAANTEPKSSSSSADSTKSDAMKDKVATSDTSASNSTTASTSDQSSKDTSAKSTDSSSTVASSTEPKSSASTSDQSDKPASPSTAASSTDKDQNLTPTGKTSADSTPAGTDADLASAAHLVRQALDSDDSLAKLDVRVTPENGKLVLRGNVSDETTKITIETKARERSGGKQIDNQLKVQSK